MMTATAIATASHPAPVRKNELKRLIKLAATGDREAAHRLISPFVSPGEKLVSHGISARFGLFPTYDFLFLTDRQIGDLEITPLTGHLNVEVAFLNKIDAFTLSQPAFPILLRLFMWSCYLLIPGFFGWRAYSFVGADLLGLVLGAGAFLIGGYLVYAAVNPSISRAFLHFRKSGIWLKLTGANVGVLIFADRNKFEMMTRLSRQLSEMKRSLDLRMG